jgi:hypothetical protein
VGETSDKYEVSTEMHAGFWWENVTVGNNLEDLGMDGRIVLSCILQE